MSKRVNDALSTLVKSLIPAVLGEDEGSEQERHEEALGLAKGILNKFVPMRRYSDLLLIRSLATVQLPNTTISITCLI